jgi:hypothetical protein
MLETTQLVPIKNDDAAKLTPLQAPEFSIRKKVEHLPFTVRIVREESDLDKAVTIRHKAYARHLPALAATLKTPESIDRELGAAVLLAESKLDGSPLGSIRIHSNRYGKLSLESSLKFPHPLDASSLAHASRLGIQEGRVGAVVKISLFKAYYQFCVGAKIDWLVIAARPPLDRQYEDLMFDDMFPDAALIPLQSANGIPHRVMKFEVATAELRWREASHRLYDFVFRTSHPDIDVSGAESALEDGGVDQSEPVRIMGLKA